MNSNLNKFLSLILIIAFTSLVNAQTTVFRSLTMDNGLSNFVVTSFYKDSAGFMWIGTDISLDRFDGVNFKHFSFDSPEINKKRVRCIAETHKNNIYVGNGLGLWQVNFKSAKLERAFPEIINSGVSALKWDAGSKVLYIGSEKGLFTLKNNNINFYAIEKNVLSAANFISDILIDDHAKLWITTRQGLCFFDPLTLKSEIYEYDMVKNQQSFFAKITRIKSTLYIGTSKTGVISFDIYSKKFSQFIDVGSDIITDISSDQDDKLYVATDGNGVHFISHSEKRIYDSYRYNPNNKSGIRSNSAYSLLVDRDGIVWIGFYQAGLDYKLYQNSYFNVYKFPPKFDSKDLHVRSFLIIANDKLIGTRDGLFLVNEKKNQVLTFDKKQLRSNLILSLCHFKGKYYIGTYGGGLSVMDEKTHKIGTISNDFSLLKGHVFHIEPGPDGNLWFASSGGIYSYNSDNGELTSFTNSNSQILPGNVYYLYFDSSKKGWIATENGLCIYDPNSKSIKTTVFPDGFFNKEIIKVIYEDADKTLYFCPDKGNIFTTDINMRKFSSFNLTSRFDGRVFLSILKDKTKNFWIGTDNGLIRIRDNEDSYYSFGFRDGVSDPVFSTDAIFLDQQDKLWFGNAKGLLYVERDKLTKTQHKPVKVTITEFNVNGETWDKNRTLDTDNIKKFKLDYNDNNIKVGFVSMQYTDPATIVYEYKLEGYENRWIVLPKGQSEIVFNNLKPGKYKLKVRTEGNSLSERHIDIVIYSFFSIKFWVVFIIISLVLYFSASKIIHLIKKMKQHIVNLSANNQRNSNEKESTEKYKFSKITENECKTLSESLYNYFENKKPYTNPNLKLADIAEALKCSTHTLSFIFNQHLTKNYYDFINEYRIREFQKLVSESESNKYTLTALAEECGFSSRASFFRSFKKLTGITPNEYIRSVGKTIHELDSDEE